MAVVSFPSVQQRATALGVEPRFRLLAGSPPNVPAAASLLPLQQ